MTDTFLRARGCAQHNLKDVDVDIPKGQLVVVTGVSGSGKSSLAFDTLYAEGQRRYVECLAPRLRQTLKQLPRPELRSVTGLSPTLALSQNHGRISKRATVATHSDIYEFLTLLYVKVGIQYSPLSERRLQRFSRQEIVEEILGSFKEGTRIQLLAPVQLSGESLRAAVMRLQTLGFVRLRLNGRDFHPEDELEEDAVGTLEAVVDRLVIKEGIRERLSSSIDTALDLGLGILRVLEGREGPIHNYSEVYVCPDSGESFAPLRVQDFRFNGPHGACPSCQGSGCEECRFSRLKATARHCLVQGRAIHELCSFSAEALMQLIATWQFEGNDALIAAEILPEITSRLELLLRVGLGYLELNRPGNTLSVGENQRVQLAAHLGSQLSGVLYVLDEPTHGLHAQEIEDLCGILESLCELGNSLLVVEHHPAVMRRADHILELGPGAGQRGGELTFSGSLDALCASATNVTGPWLAGKRQLEARDGTFRPEQQLQLSGITQHNLKNFSVNIPLGGLIAFCGVSGSGKSTLVVDIISQMELSQFNRCIVADQRTPRGSQRSLVATFAGLMTPLRQLYAETRLAKARGWTASYFTLSRKGARCEVCHGLGEVTVDLPMLNDLRVTCETCNGRRLHYEALQVLWQDISLADVLDMEVDEALRRFEKIPQLRFRLSLLSELGLGYLQLGQLLPTLSGGELQRLKLAADLFGKQMQPALYILDEPSSGLHFEDIDKLARTLDRLVAEGHTVFMVEHNLDMIRRADWVIELGPGGGPHGGQLVFEGRPEGLLKADTPTGSALRR